MKDCGIATQPGTHAPAFQSCYADRYSIKPDHFPEAYLAERITLTLPLYPSMSDEEQDEVVKELLRSFEGR